MQGPHISRFIRESTIWEKINRKNNTGSMVAAMEEGSHSCAMCGQTLSVSSVTETIDGIHLTFHSERCAVTFKKLQSVYGRSFLEQSSNDSNDSNNHSNNNNDNHH
jgi:hypothetical protein